MALDRLPGRGRGPRSLRAARSGHLNLSFRDPLVGAPGPLPPARGGPAPWHDDGARTADGIAVSDGIAVTDAVVDEVWARIRACRE